MTPDIQDMAASARALLAAYRSQPRFIAAWLLGELTEEEKGILWQAADILGIRPLLEELTRPAAHEEYLRLIDAAQCLAQGRRRQTSGLTEAVRQDAVEVTRQCHEELFAWLAQLGISFSSGAEAAEATLLLRHVAGVEAVARFREIQSTLEQMRRRLGADHLTAADRAALADFPEAAEQEEDGTFSWQMSYRLFAWRRLLWLCRERSSDSVPPEHRWRVEGGLGAAYARWAEVRPDTLAAIIGPVGDLLAETSGVSKEVRPLFAADPRSDTRAEMRVTRPSLTEFIFSGRSEPLREQLMKYPIFRVALRRASLPAELEDDFLDFIREHLPAQKRPIPDLLPSWLTAFAQKHGVDPPPDAASWSGVLEQAAVEQVLHRKAAGEPSWARGFKEHALAAGAVTLEELAGLPFDLSPYKRTAGFRSFREDLELQAAVALEEVRQLDPLSAVTSESQPLESSGTSPP